MEEHAWVIPGLPLSQLTLKASFNYLTLSDLESQGNPPVVVVFVCLFFCCFVVVGFFFYDDDDNNETCKM